CSEGSCSPLAELETGPGGMGFVFESTMASSVAAAHHSTRYRAMDRVSFWSVGFVPWLLAVGIANTMCPPTSQPSALDEPRSYSDQRSPASDRYLFSGGACR